MTERIPWTHDEAKVFCTLKLDSNLSYEGIDEEMHNLGYPRRGGNARKDAFRRNQKVRTIMFGDDLYRQRQPEVLKKTIQNGEMGPVTMVNTNRPRTENEMAELFGIDEELFYPHRVITNQWAMNWQTKIDWRLNEGNAVAKSFLFEDLLDRFSGTAWPNLVCNINQRDPDCIDIIEIVDAHHGALSWAPETGNNWDLKISLAEHTNAHAHFLKNRHGKNALVRIGDDIFHFDTLIQQKAGATQRGTVQDIDSRWQKMFIEVTEMMIDLLISTARVYEKVYIYLLQGNHDYQTSYYLGQLLQSRFGHDPQFVFDVRPRVRKYFRYGSTLLGFAHSFGKLGINSLADKIREEAREDWGQSDYTEFHIGDKHHEEVIDKTGTGVVVRILRSLTPNDSWHDEEGFSSHRGAQMFTFHRTEGLFRTTYYRTRKQGPYRPDTNIGVSLRG